MTKGELGKRRRPGEVRDAIVDYLRSHKEGGTVAEILVGVEQSLGRTVPPSSVRSSLNLNNGDLFDRVGHGRYRLREHK
jgi:hypothetical protein